MSSFARIGCAAAVAVLALPGSLTAATSTVTSAELRLMPLPEAAFGAKVAALPLASDSGVDSNSQAASNASGRATAAQLTRLGRVTGYALDYGGPPSAQGVFEAETEVELYRSPAAAADGLAFWRGDEQKLGPLGSIGAKVTMTYFAPPRLGGPSFGFGGRAELKGAPPFYGGDIDFQRGDLIAKVTIVGSDPTAWHPIAVAAARALKARIEGVLAGRVTGPPVSLKGAARKAGPPPSGPSLAALAVRPSDFGIGNVTKQGYRVDTNFDPVSEYDREFSPAGPFTYLGEQVMYFTDPVRASYTFAILSAFISSARAWAAFGGNSGGLKSYTPRSVPVHEGDQAKAVIASAKLTDGRVTYLGFVAIRTGKTFAFVVCATAPGARLLPAAIEQLARVVSERAKPKAHKGLTA